MRHRLRYVWRWIHCVGQCSVHEELVCLPNDYDLFDMHLQLYDVCELQYIRKKSTYEHYVLARIRETRGDRERMFVQRD